MAVQPVIYEANLGGVLAQRAYSPAIWGGAGACPIGQIIEGSTPGIHFYDDFQFWTNNPAITLTTVVNVGDYQAFATSTCTIPKVSSINSVAVAGGALALTMDSTTAHSATLAQPFGNYLLGTAANSGKLWFEACIGISTVAANTTGFFLGLAEVGTATAYATGIPFTSNTGLAISNSQSMIGFNLPTNGLGQAKTVYSDRATSFTAVGATDCSLLTAYTFTRLGMIYDPTATGTVSTNSSSCAVQFYQDNVLLPNGITGATMTATTNLNANNLGLIITAINGSTGGGVLYLKWWRCGQLLPN